MWRDNVGDGQKQDWGGSLVREVLLRAERANDVAVTRTTGHDMCDVVSVATAWVDDGTESWFQ